MNRILTATVSALAALSLGTGVYTVAAMPASASTVRPVHAPHEVSCRTKLIVIAAAERGTSGAGALAAAGLPELASAARAATNVTGARFYGMALAKTAAALNGCQPKLPSWVAWGGTSDRSGGTRCIAVWGQQYGVRNRGTAAEICGDGFAGLS